jgi:hypothetical protein
MYRGNPNVTNMGGYWDDYDWLSAVRNTGLTVISLPLGAASSGVTLGVRQAGHLGEEIVNSPTVQLGGVLILGALGLVLYLALRDRY